MTAPSILSMNWSIGMEEYFRDLREKMLGPLPLRRRLEVKLEAAQQAVKAGFPNGEQMVINTTQLLILLDAIERKLSHNDQSVTTSEGER